MSPRDMSPRDHHSALSALSAFRLPLGRPFAMRPTHWVSHAHLPRAPPRLAPVNHASLPRAARRLARVSAASLVLSVMLMLVAGFTGPSATVPAFPSAFPWPPYMAPLHLSDVLVIGLAWL